MDRGKKVLIIVLVNIVMLGVLVGSVYMLLFRADTALVKNVCTALVVISIPVIFYVTYMSIAGEKFEYREEDFEDDEDPEGTLSGKGLESEEKNFEW